MVKTVSSSGPGAGVSWVTLTHEQINSMDPELWLDLHRGQLGAWRTNHPGHSVDIPVDHATAVWFWLRFGPDRDL
jgi:hypothetical protein